MKQRKAFYILGGLLLLIFAGFSFSEFKDSLTPYVSYETAQQSQRPVQVAGGLEQGSTDYNPQDGFLRFTVVDPESAETLRVRYEGPKPANFEDAVSIVAIGKYDTAAAEFDADKLLVKCPSKYQGLEETETKSYGDESYGTESYDTETETKSYG